MSWIKTRYGEVLNIPEDEAGQHLSVGAAYASEEEIKNELEKEYYSQPGEQFKAGIEGGLRGVSAGVSDFLLPDKEAALLRKKHNPITAGVTSAGGSLAGLIGTGPLGAVARVGAKGALKGALGTALKHSPAGLAARASLGLEKSIAKKIASKSGAESAVNQIVAKTAGIGGAGAFEGAIAGVEEVVSESALGDPRLTAESALDTILFGTVTGAGLGAGLGSIGSSTTVGFRKAKDMFDSAFKGKDPVSTVYEHLSSKTGMKPGATEILFKRGEEVSRFRQTFPDADTLLRDKDPEMVTWLLDNAEKLKQAEMVLPGSHRTLAYGTPESSDKLLNNLDKIMTSKASRDEVAEEMYTSMKKSVDAVRQASKEGYNRVRKEEMRKLALNTTKPADVRQRLMETNNGIKKFLKQAYAEERSPFDAGMLNELNSISRRMDDRFGLAVTPEGKRVVDKDILDEDIFEAWRELENVKKDLAHISNPARAVNPSQQAMMPALRDLAYKPMIEIMEDQKLWGAFAPRYAALNNAEGAWREMFKTKGVGDMPSFYEAFMEKGRYKYKPKVSRKKIKKWLDNFDTPAGEEGSKVFEQMMQAGKGLINEWEGSIRNSGIKNIDSKAWTDILETTLKDRAKVVQNAQLSRQFEGLQQLEKRHPQVGPAVDDMAGAGVSMGLDIAAVLAPGIATLAPVMARRMYNSFKKGGFSAPRAASTLSYLKKAKAKMEELTGKIAKSIVKGTKVAQPRRALTRVAVRVAANNASAKEQIDQAINKENSDEVKAAITDMAEHAPETAAAAQGLMNNRQAALMSSLPKIKQKGLLGKEMPLTPSQKKSLATRIRVMTDLPGALKEFEAGIIDPVAVEAMRTFWPSIYEDIKTKMIQEAMENEKLTRAETVRMMLFTGEDVDGSLTDGISSQEVYAQAAAERQEQQQQNEKTAVRRTQRRMTEHTSYMKTATRNIEES